MELLKITIGPDVFTGALQTDLAPQTCAKFKAMLPWNEKLIHVRWSGEGCWIPLGDLDFELGYENATSHPRPGEFILYPGGVSETEILMAYNGVRFASKAGQLAGNPFLIIRDKLDRLAEIGREILWEGASQISFSALQ